MADPERNNSSERLVARLGAELRRGPTAHRAGLHLAAFLAQRDEITETLEHGFSMKAIWTQLKREGKVQMAYETFRDYCRASGLGRRPLTARRAKATNAGGMPQQTFEHSSMPDGKRLY